jgi:pyruvate formate lyase activating enzyme
VEELLPKILQDLPYYRRSGGGLTLSGGECLCQPDFALALLRTAKDYGIHTAIETTAVVDYSVLERLLPYLDLVLLDIKHTDSRKHREFTTQPNERILANAARLAGDARELIIRVPTIPTFNESDEEILAIARFAASLGTVRELHLLPYHRLGYDKYVGLGRPYEMGEIPSPTPARMEQLRKLAASTGLTVHVGG